MLLFFTFKTKLWWLWLYFHWKHLQNSYSIKGWNSPTLCWCKMLSLFLIFETKYDANKIKMELEESFELFRNEGHCRKESFSCHLSFMQAKIHSLFMLTFWSIHGVWEEPFISHNLICLTKLLASLRLSWKKLLLDMNTNETMSNPTNQTNSSRRKRNPSHTQILYSWSLQKNNKFAKDTHQDILWHWNF